MEPKVQWEVIRVLRGPKVKREVIGSSKNPKGKREVIKIAIGPIVQGKVIMVSMEGNVQWEVIKDSMRSKVQEEFIRVSTWSKVQWEVIKNLHGTKSSARSWTTVPRNIIKVQTQLIRNSRRDRDWKKKKCEQINTKNYLFLLKSKIENHYLIMISVTF